MDSYRRETWLFMTIRRRICGDILPRFIECCIMLYNFITFSCIILRTAAKKFDWAVLPKSGIPVDVDHGLALLRRGSLVDSG